MFDRVTGNRVAQHGLLPIQDYQLRSAAAEASLIPVRQFADTTKPNVKPLAFPMPPSAPVSFSGHVVEGPSATSNVVIVAIAKSQINYIFLVRCRAILQS